MQTKRQSLIEVVVSYVIGFIVALISQIIIFPLYNMNVPLTSNLQITLWFTIISVTRSYLVRRFFNKRHAILNKEKQV